MKNTRLHFIAALGTLLLIGCFGGSGNDVYVQPANFNPAGELTANYTAMIGKTVRIFSAEGRPFEEPIAVTLVDAVGRKFPVPHVFDDQQNPTIQIPPKINAGTARLEVSDKNHAEPLTGKIDIQRLGVIANPGNGSLVVFDTANPNVNQRISLESVGGQPNDVVISADGRYAEISLAGAHPGTVALDLTTQPPQLASTQRPTPASPHEISLLPDTFMALIPNTGENVNPGETVDVVGLDQQGLMATTIDQVNVGPQGMPFAIATHLGETALALISNRNTTTPRITRLDLQNCQTLAASGCTQSIFTLIDRDVATDQDPELTGIAIHPNGEQAWVADYRNAKIYALAIGQGQLQKTPGATVSLDQGGGQGPVAIRISPGGGRVFVLNELSSNLSVLRFQGGSLTYDFSIPLGGERPGKMNFSHEGKKLWISFRGSNEVKTVDLNLFRPRVSPALEIGELNQPKGIAVQP